MVFLSTKPRPLAGRAILQIIPELEAGGAERTTIDIAEGLVQAGAYALVATQGGRLIGELQAKGGAWIPFPAATKNPFAMAMNVRRLIGIIKAEGVELIHARSRAPAWVAFAAARQTGIGFITTYHGAYSGRSAPKLLYNSVMARGDIVIANSHYTAEQIETLHPIRPNQLRVIHRGTNLEAFSQTRISVERIEKLRRSWMVEPHEQVVLLAARLTPWKGQRVLIEAAAKLRARGYPDLVFILAGDPQGRTDYVNELDQMISQAGLSGIVRRVGHVADMPAALSASSVVTVPSTEPEAFGRVAVEAQALGIPVIVSNLGAVPETVLAPPQVRPEQRTGWRVEAGSAEELATAIAAVMDMGPSAKGGLARRARAHVEAHFSLDKMVSETLDCYRAVLEGKMQRQVDFTQE
jgi:glycosyltransferase involved in cell wall biosynthesis